MCGEGGGKGREGGVVPIKSKSLPPFSAVRMEEEEEEEGRKQESGFSAPVQNVASNREDLINIYPELLSWAAFFCTTLLTFVISRRCRWLECPLPLHI